MTTKLEIQTEAQEKIKEDLVKLEQLNEEHKKYEPEHIAREKHEEKADAIKEKIDKLEEKKWEGNFEERDNWYHGRIPTKFKRLVNTIEDEGIIKEVLETLSRENEEKIKKTEEYKDLEKQIKELGWYSFSQEHRQLDDEIDNLNRRIEWERNLYNRVEDRGELIKWAKHLKEKEEYENKAKEKKKKIAVFREKIIKLNVTNSLK